MPICRKHDFINKFDCKNTFKYTLFCDAWDFTHTEEMLYHRAILKPQIY